MKDGMTKWTKSHALTPKLTHDFKCTWYESKTMLEMMLEKNVYVINLKCSLVVDIFRFLWIM